MARPTRKQKPDLPVVSLDESDDFIKAFIYGPPKAGKTVLAASASVFSKAAPVLMCDVEGGRKSLRGAPPSIIDKKQLYVLSITEFEQFNKVYQVVSDNPGRFNTVIIDSVTEVHTMCMEAEMQDVVRKDPTREEFVPSMREYGIVRNQLRKMIREFRDLPIHFIITAMIRYDEDDNGLVIKSPQLAGQLRSEIPGYCDVVALLEVEKPRKRRGQPDEEVKRVLHLAEVSRAVVGTRSWDIPQSLENPVFEDLYKTIIGG